MNNDETRVAASPVIRPASASDSTAIAFVLMSALLYMLGYSVSKILVERYGLEPMQLTFLRCFLVFLVICPIALIQSRRRSATDTADSLANAVSPVTSSTASSAALPAVLPGISWHQMWSPPKAWQQRAAAAVLVVSNALAVLAYSLQPVTQASALAFTAPLLLILLSGLMLRERIPLNRWIGIALAFGGMLLIVRPGSGILNVGILASFGGALFYALYQALIRRLRESASALDSAVQFALVGTIMLGIPMFFVWQPLTWESFGVAVLMTVIQTTALACIAAAMRRSEASRLAPWQFSGLLWAMLMDALVFHGSPSPLSLGGAGLIIAGGLLSRGRAAPAKA